MKDYYTMRTDACAGAPSKGVFSPRADCTQVIGPAQASIAAQVNIGSVRLSDLIKESNPKDAVGLQKAPWSTVPAPVIGEVGLAMLEGALKYGRHNYRAIGVRASVYYDALMRHMSAWWEGQDIDPDSGLPHLAKAMACLVVMRDAEMNDNMADDRPPPVKHQDWVTELNARAKALIAKYPDPKAPYTK